MPFQFGPYTVSDDAAAFGPWALAGAANSAGEAVRLTLLRLPESLAEGDRARVNEAMDRAVAEGTGQKPPAGIAAVVDGGQMEGGVYLVESAPGVTLRASVDQQTMPVESVAPFLQSVAGALDNLHAAGETHPWLSPDNVVLGPSGATLAGVAWSPILTMLQNMDPLSEWPESAYVAPEARAGGKPTARSETYSAAAMAIFAVTGQAPGPSPDLSALPPALAMALARGLHPDPAERYAGAKEMVVDITVEQAIAVQDQAAENAVPTGGDVPDWAKDLLLETSERRDAGRPLVDTAPAAPAPAAAAFAPQPKTSAPRRSAGRPPAIPVQEPEPQRAAPPEPVRSPEGPGRPAASVFNWEGQSSGPTRNWVPILAGAISALFLILGLALTILRHR
ncbi:MAG TPA: hypothetical protein VGM37_09700 [Armatimonadota bacterium]|jgi:serine/threonine protein kinase